MIKNALQAYLFDINSLTEESFNRLLLSVKKYRIEKIDKLAHKQNKYLSLKRFCEQMQAFRQILLT